MVNEPVVDIRQFRKTYGARCAVDGLTLQIPRGTIYGLLGPNAAGKTTLIRAILNLVRPTSGCIKVFGTDSVRDTLAVRSRVGYVPERPSCYAWMTVDEILWFNAGFYPHWDRDLALRLCETLRLPLTQRVEELSAGGEAKVGLVMALAQRPDLLILDDPAAGLDVIVRREILRTMLSTVHAEGKTVLYASHRLGEVERVADRIALLCEGHLLLESSIDDLRQGWRKVRASFPERPPYPVRLDGLVRAHHNAHHVELVMDAYHPGVNAALAQLGATSVQARPLRLEEIFIERVEAAGRRSAAT